MRERERDLGLGTGSKLCLALQKRDRLMKDKMKNYLMYLSCGERVCVQVVQCYNSRTITAVIRTFTHTECNSSFLLKR